MAKTPRYQAQFNEQYERSTPETRALFDDPETREQAGKLYRAWRSCEDRRERYRAGIRNRVKKQEEPKIFSTVDWLEPHIFAALEFGRFCTERGICEDAPYD